MGRYDGEDFDYAPECSPSNHMFAFNGYCSRCGNTRGGLAAHARSVLAVFGTPEEQEQFKAR